MLFLLGRIAPCQQMTLPALPSAQHIWKQTLFVLRRETTVGKNIPKGFKLSNKEQQSLTF